MKKLVVLFSLCALTTFAETNLLTLTWSQPPGYTSTLYSSTNLAGSWSELSTNPPPYSTQETNPVAYFTVIVVPPAQPSITFSNYGGSVPNFTPTDTALSVDTFNGSYWTFYGGSWH